MATICPKTKKGQFGELTRVLGSSEMAHLIWDRNKGNTVDFSPDGKQSTLFKQLLEYTNNNRVEAIRLKSTYYLDQYTEANGKWYDDFEAEPIAETVNIANISFDEVENVSNMILNKLLIKQRPYILRKKNKLKEDFWYNSNEGVAYTTADNMLKLIIGNIYNLEYSTSVETLKYKISTILSKNLIQSWKDKIESLEEWNNDK